jgi:hypothetical protein
MEARYLFPGNASTSRTFVEISPPAFEKTAYNNNAFNVGFFGYVPEAEEMLQGEAEFYCFSGTDYRTIQFYGTPSEDVPAQTTGLWDANIPNCVIMEFYRLPDEVNGHVIPHYFRFEMTKNYILSRAFMKEGPGQRPDLAKYYNSMYDQNTATYREILKACYRGQMYSYESPQDSQIGFAPRARYPLNYGIPSYDY